MSTRTDTGRPGSTGATVQLLLDHDRNRRLLADRLGADHTVVETVPDDLSGASFDVCIVDARSFERHRDDLAARKRREEPAFLPYLFLTDGRRRERVPDAVWDAVDGVLATPIVPAELAHRLDNLLERRRLSLDLERRKQRSEERFETLFETAPDPVVVTSAEGAISEVNEAFARAVGASSEDLVGRSVTDLEFASPDAVERVLLRITDSNGPPESTPNSVQLERDDGDLVLELNAEVVTASGAASERIGIFRDVTEREERATALREQNRRLEEFASTIAHDLRNPLSIARGHLDLARTDGDPEHFDAAVRAHDRMEELIDEVLTLAKQGQLVMDPEPVSLDDVATRAWATVDTTGATLSVDGSEELLADEGRLVECFENLFRNAVEHGSTGDRTASGDGVERGSTGSRAKPDAVEHGSTGPDSGTRRDAVACDDPVRVRVGWLESGDEPGLYVEDDGPGIPETDRDDVFEAGYTDSEDGTGFGLAIVRQIVDGHGWDVSVTASEAGGARFEVVGVERP